MNGVRSLNRAEVEAFRLARLVAAERAPYFMHALFAAAPLAAPGLGTFAVDGSWRLYMDPELLVPSDGNGWSPQTAGAVLLHEVGHLLRDHSGRAAALPARNHLAWNLAGDAEINDDLLAAGVPLPQGVVTPAARGCPDGDLAETYYAHLTDDAARPLADDGSPGCGSGSGSPAVPGELPAGISLDNGDAPGLDTASGDLVRRRVAAEVKASEQAGGRGSIPAGLSRWAEQTLRAPEVAWERVLRASIRRALADRAGRVNYTYRRPSRRQVPGIVRPAMRAPALSVAVVVDTSGSMTQADLNAAMSEVAGVLNASGIARERTLLLSCDAEASTARRIRSLADVRLVGGGGTDMRIGIAEAEAARPRPDVVIVLTDGDTPWPDRPCRARLVCAVISARAPRDTPAWATTVHITPAA